MAKPRPAKRRTRKSVPEKADIAVIEAVRPALSTRAARVLGKIGEVGDQPPLLALSGATLAVGLLRGDRKLARTGTGMIVAHLIATGFKKIGKDNVDRSRPRHVMKGGRYRMERGTSEDPSMRSFPSGHTAGAVALAAAVAREYPEARGSAYAAAAAIGALQLPRRAHFPTDVLAGAVAGYAAEWIGHRLIRAVLAGAAGLTPEAGVLMHPEPTAIPQGDPLPIPVAQDRAPL